MCRSIAVVMLLLCAGWMPTASGQVFYESVQYQYKANGATFYYGGRNPQMFGFVARDAAATSYSLVTATEHVMDRTRVYSDVLPMRSLADNSYTGYTSMTAADARNEANASVPCYFRKRDLLRSAVMTQDGAIVVPAAAAVDGKGAELAPGMPKGTILIIPKKLLQPPAKENAPQVVSAKE